MAIDEKKLIKSLEDDMDSLFPRVFGKVHPNDAFGLYLELKAMIDNQPKISLENKTSDWIPVTERLPEEEGVYLATFKNMFNQFVETVWFDSDGFFVKSKATVVAWMPLPEAYKGGEK